MLNEMKYVYEVYCERSFTKAAKKLLISQPALSSKIKQAEQELGAAIFDRSMMPLGLTKEGEFYINEAKQILQIEQNVRTYFDDIKHLYAGSLSLGGSTFFCSYVLPNMITRFKSLYPNVSISILEGNLKELRGGLNSGDVDLIIETAVHEGDPEFDTFFYKNESILFAVPKSNSINRRLTEYQWNDRVDFSKPNPFPTDVPPVPLNEFRDASFIMLKEGNDLGGRGARLCEQAGFTPKTIMKTDQLQTAAHIAEQGLGVTFIRADLLRYDPHILDMLCIYALPGPIAQRKIFFATKKGKYLTSAMRTFLRMAGVELPEGDTQADK